MLVISVVWSAQGVAELGSLLRLTVSESRVPGGGHTAVFSHSVLLYFSLHSTLDNWHCHQLITACHNTGGEAYADQVTCTGPGGVWHRPIVHTRACLFVSTHNSVTLLAPMFPSVQYQWQGRAGQCRAGWAPSVTHCVHSQPHYYPQLSAVVSWIISYCVIFISQPKNCYI